MKFRWLNYFLVLILFNVTLHVFYLYLLLGAHDSLDGTASSLYSFEQALVLCKKEMIYRDLGLATREALALALSRAHPTLTGKHIGFITRELGGTSAQW